jgi:flagellar motor component MotA
MHAHPPRPHGTFAVPHVVAPLHPVRSAAFWALFAAAAVIFVLDAVTTMHVAAMRPIAIEENPIARWSLELHPVGPYLLKAAVVATCTGVVIALRAMAERRWALAVVVAMAVVGLLGIATGFGVVRA